MTVFILIFNTRAVSLTPLPLSAISTILSLTPAMRAMDGEYSAIAADFLSSVSEHKKSLRGVKSFESPYVVVPLGREVWATRTNRG